MAKWSDEKMADLTRKLADTAIDYKQRCEVLEERWEAACQDAKEAEAYAEELEAKLASCEKYRDAYAECDRIAAQAVHDLEAKLAKAADVIDWALICWDDHNNHEYRMQGDWVRDARATLAAITETPHD